MIGQTISHYEILEKLGEGGMGVVYKARDSRLDRLVALKFLPPEFSGDTEANERFMQEARAASALEHSNICVVHDIDRTEDGRLFIVMPAYEGQTLKYRIQQEIEESTETSIEKSAEKSIANTVDVAAQIAEGLARAHEAGIVHRDIKPANIYGHRSGRGEDPRFRRGQASGNRYHENRHDPWDRLVHES